MATFGDASQANGSTSSYNVAVPAGTVDGSYLVAIAGNDSGASATTLTLAGGTTWQELTSGVSSITTYKAWWKLAGPSEGANYTVNQNTSAGTVHVIRVVTNSTSAPTVQVTTTPAGSGTTTATPGITPPDAASLEIRAALARPSPTGAITWTSPGGLTERTDTQSGTASTGTTATRTLPDGSATTSLNFTTVTNVGSRVGITIAVPDSPPPQVITPSGVVSGEAFGTAQLNLAILASGVPSGEAFGATRVGVIIRPSGIASAEAFGNADLTKLFIAPVGIASGAAFGLTNVAIEKFILPTGIISGEAFGTPGLQLGYPQTIEPFGIESAEVVEDPFVRLLHQLVLVNPSIQETPAAWDPLNIRFGLDRGITIMKSGGVWRQVRYPAQTELEAAERFYLGGRRHVLTVDQAQELIDAGYGSYIELELIT